MEYKVNEIFHSLQGEGYWAGVPMFFVRLSGCNLNCPWCDTEHESGEMMEEDEILDQVQEMRKVKLIQRICITGGEPTIYDLGPLTDSLGSWFNLHLETNGTRLLEEHERFEWVTVSPKFPPGLADMPQFWGDELKVPVAEDVSDLLVEQCAAWGHFHYRYLQPVDGPVLKKNSERCLELTSRMVFPWRVSMQGHKRLQLR